MTKTHPIFDCIVGIEELVTKVHSREPAITTAIGQAHKKY